ncbi:Na+/H+ antiporter subunit E [Micromonospora sp. NPDC003197]
MTPPPAQPSAEPPAERPAEPTTQPSAPPPPPSVEQRKRSELSESPVIESPLTELEPETPRVVPPRTRWRDQAVAVGWLILVWNLLWGEFTWGNIVGGLAVALVVLLFFPLPPVTFEGRLRPIGLLRFGTRFIYDLITASAQVAWTALRPRYQPRNAIIAVPLRVRSDLNLTLTAEAVSLVPGSLIVEVDRSAGVLYVHVLDVRGPEDLDQARQDVLDLEARILRAVGSKAELRQLQQSPIDRGAII